MQDALVVDSCVAGTLWDTGEHGDPNSSRELRHFVETTLSYSALSLRTNPNSAISQLAKKALTALTLEAPC